MSATIKEQQRKREAEDLLNRTRQANERAGVLALLAAFEAGQKQIAGAAEQSFHARGDFLTARAWATRLVGSMYATPLRRLLAGFIEISHVWAATGAVTPLDRAAAGVTLEGLAQQLRTMVGE